MIERFGLTTDSDLEAALRDLASVVEWPATPDVTATLRSTLAARLAADAKPRRAWLPRLLFQPSLTRALLLAGVLALLVAGAAIGIRFGLDLLQIEFGPVPTLVPATSDKGSTLGLGARTTLEEIQRNGAFFVAVPTDPGTPDEVYLGGQNLRGQVAFVYAPREGLPPNDLLNGAGLLITQNRGSTDAGLVRKIVDSGGTAERVTVHDSAAYWITGGPHGFWYLAPDGEVIFESLRLVGNTLAWERGDILYRIEGAITLERALQIAESMP